MKASQENLIKLLKTIGWSVRDHGCGYFYIYNYKNENIHWFIREDRIERDKNNFDENPTVCFYFKGCYLEVLESNTVCLTAKGTHKSVFVFFANYGHTKEHKEDHVSNE